MVVYEDIQFDKVKKVKEIARVERMKKIREVQFAYREENRKFAKTWDDLTSYAKDGKISIIKTIETFDEVADTLLSVRKDTSSVNVVDSLFNGFANEIDSLPYIPFSKENVKFSINAGKLELRGGVLVDVFEVTDMDPIYQDPDADNNDPSDRPLQLGNMGASNFDLNRDPSMKK